MNKRSGYETSQLAIAKGDMSDTSLVVIMDKKIVTNCAACWTCLSREMALMRDYALNELISPPSLVCKKNSSHLHSLRVGFLFDCTDLGEN